MTAKEAAAQFENQRKHCRTLHLFYVLGLMIAIIILVLWGTQPAFIFFAALLVVYYTVVRGSIRKFTADWREFCVRLFTEKHFGKVNYSYKADAESLPLYVNHVLVPMSSKGKLLARNLAIGSNAGIDATFLDSTVPVGEGRAIRFLSGCWMGMAFESLADAPMRIVKGDLPTQSGAFQPCEAPEGMPKDCAFFTAGGAAKLPEAVMDALKTLLNDMAYDGVIEIRPEGLFVFLPQRLINKLPPSLKYPVTAERVERLSFPEIDAAYMLALKLRKN